MRETMAEAQLRARKALIAADIDGSALDARLIMQAATGFTLENLIANSQDALSIDSLAKFDAMLRRRLSHEPVSRILGEREFYGRSFCVTPDVLDPRADTETLVELSLAEMQSSAAQLLDLGTGSGAIAITLLCERPNMRGVAVDLSTAALDVAKNNAKRLGVLERLQLSQGSWFSGLLGRFDLIVSNPPYIIASHVEGLGEEVKNFDPHLALDGGPDGLEAYRAIAQDAGEYLAEDGVIVLEIGAGQMIDVSNIFAGHGFYLDNKRADLGGHVRALGFKSVKKQS